LAVSGRSESVATSAERPSWTDREDQLAAGFSELACTSCSTVVRVRKMSPAQTSVQWPADSSCPFLGRDEAGTPVESCARLDACIRAAVQQGSIPVGPQ
jgi:hypothetical protein